MRLRGRSIALALAVSLLALVATARADDPPALDDDAEVVLRAELELIRRGIANPREPLGPLVEQLTGALNENGPDAFALMADWRSSRDPTVNRVWTDFDRAHRKLEAMSTALERFEAADLPALDRLERVAVLDGSAYPRRGWLVPGDAGDTGAIAVVYDAALAGVSYVDPLALQILALGDEAKAMIASLSDFASKPFSPMGVRTPFRDPWMIEGAWLALVALRQGMWVQAGWIADRLAFRLRDWKRWAKQPDESGQSRAWTVEGASDLWTVVERASGQVRFERAFVDLADGMRRADLVRQLYVLDRAFPASVVPSLRDLLDALRRETDQPLTLEPPWAQSPRPEQARVRAIDALVDLSVGPAELDSYFDAQPPRAFGSRARTALDALLGLRAQALPAIVDALSDARLTRTLVPLRSNFAAALPQDYPAGLGTHGDDPVWLWRVGDIAAVIFARLTGIDLARAAAARDLNPYDPTTLQTLARALIDAPNAPRTRLDWLTHALTHPGRCSPARIGRWLVDEDHADGARARRALLAACEQEHRDGAAQAAWIELLLALDDAAGGTGAGLPDWAARLMASSPFAETRWVLARELWMRARDAAGVPAVLRDLSVGAVELSDIAGIHARLALCLTADQQASAAAIAAMLKPLHEPAAVGDVTALRIPIAILHALAFIDASGRITPALDGVQLPLELERAIASLLPIRDVLAHDSVMPCGDARDVLDEADAATPVRVADIAAYTLERWVGSGQRRLWQNPACTRDVEHRALWRAWIETRALDAIGLLPVVDPVPWHVAPIGGIERATLEREVQTAIHGEQPRDSAAARRLVLEAGPGAWRVVADAVPGGPDSDARRTALLRDIANTVRAMRVHESCAAAWRESAQAVVDTMGDVLVGEVFLERDVGLMVQAMLESAEWSAPTIRLVTTRFPDGRGMLLELALAGEPDDVTLADGLARRRLSAVQGTHRLVQPAAMTTRARDVDVDLDAVQAWVADELTRLLRAGHDSGAGVESVLTLAAVR